jgi:hypothetical protein
VLCQQNHVIEIPQIIAALEFALDELIQLVEIHVAVRFPIGRPRSLPRRTSSNAAGSKILTSRIAVKRTEA